MTNKTANKFTPEIRARIVQMLKEHGALYPLQWAVVSSIAAKLLCFAHTLHEEVNKVYSDKDADLPSDMSVTMKPLEQVINDLQ